MKKYFVILLVIVFFIFGYFQFNKWDKINKQSNEQVLLENTYNISKKYVNLRYKTDNVLRNAKSYKDYDEWNDEMSFVIDNWELLDKESSKLEELSLLVSEEKTSFDFIPRTFAYDKKEISDIFDKAPAGKKIATLAKHLWVDAKMAFKILKQDQAQVEADAWNEAWDTFQTLETSATVIKDTCKVVWFIGWIVVSWWTSAIAAWWTLSTATVIITWVDLTLEVSDDAAKIALWNHNKISAIIWDWRKITEPLATILNITSIPSSFANNFEKFNAVMTWLDQFNSAVQDGKVVGIQLPAYTKDKTKLPIKTVILEKNEINKWLKETNKDKNNDTITKEEIEDILWNLKLEIIKEIITEKEEAEVDEKDDSWNEKNSEDIIWVWEWVVKSTPSANSNEVETSISFSIYEGGKVVMGGDRDWFISRRREWNIIKFSTELTYEHGWAVFSLSWDTMTLIKIEWPDQEDPTKWVEVMAGSDFFWGKFNEITLNKQ